ncbi:MAG: LysE family translocator [Bacteroidales bacterium]|nr:LysE family translocator [Bacteroidales bacterium]MBD5221858.1 LysE family translocator [Bacteroidales bacterium]
MESVFYMIWRGIAIGFMISAPMGPVGILCIQRTLNRGRRAGFFTGIGAALSDLIYCLLTGFGLSFIEEGLRQNQIWIQLFGSLVLFAFSIYLFRKKPDAAFNSTDHQPPSVKKNILGGFLFTFSNPLILFLIVGLFARFNFVLPDMKWHHYLLGFLFILVGAVGWWWIVTYAVDKVRGRFSLRTMTIINRIIGVIVFLFALVGTVSAIIDL